METLSHSFGVNARRVIRNLKTILVIFAIRHWFCPSATLEETSENDETGIFVNQSFTSELKGQATALHPPVEEMAGAAANASMLATGTQVPHNPRARPRL